MTQSHSDSHWYRISHAVDSLVPAHNKADTCDKICFCAHSKQFFFLSFISDSQKGQNQRTGQHFQTKTNNRTTEKLYEWYEMI